MNFELNLLAAQYCGKFDVCVWLVTVCRATAAAAAGDVAPA